jgi:tRNA(fMet)-specific endonuclease VapC
MTVSLSCGQGERYLLVHHVRAAGSRTEATGAGGAACHRIVVSIITYAEMRFGTSGSKAFPRYVWLVDSFHTRLDAVLPWDRAAMDATLDTQRPLLAHNGTRFKYLMLLFL